MNVEEYIKNPCGTSSIPMWKVQNMINDSYAHENISLTEEDLRLMKTHPTFDEELWIYINVDGKMIASGIAEYDKICREGLTK